jgi:hypothetical protein
MPCNPPPRAEKLKAQMHLVQLIRDCKRAVACVEGESLRVLDPWFSTYDLALHAIRRQQPLAELVNRAGSATMLDYAAVHAGCSEWRLLPPLDHPADPAHVMVSGTGLTHRVSAENRAAMHCAAGQPLTDSMRMYQLGKEGGRPTPQTIGVQPEWFYKGDGSILRAHLDELLVPPYAEDGGEEPEVAGAYVIADDGQPHRLGFMTGNEFSDHVMERQNYLYLAHSKLRSCSVGPELVLGDEELFRNVAGEVTLTREGVEIWKAKIYSGEANMCHSLANLEHHHFKYETHRRPGDVHIHFFGADIFSFGEGVRLQDGDVTQIDFPELGKPLWNTVRETESARQPVRTASI